MEAIRIADDDFALSSLTWYNRHVSRGENKKPKLVARDRTEKTPMVVGSMPVGDDERFAICAFGFLHKSVFLGGFFVWLALFFLPP